MTRKRGPHGFAPANRLHSSAEFRYLQRQGIRAESAHFVVYAGRFPTDGGARLGVTVSKRVGSSVMRNRIKRRVRETFRLTLRPMLAEGTAMVVIARPGAGALSSAALGAELVTATQTVARRFQVQRSGSR